jgi:PHP family Zn ribbon phosphoesterase
MSKSLMETAPSIPKVRVKLDAKFPPSNWVCPQCGTKVRTHVETYVIECRNTKHSRKLVYMEAQ